MVADNSSALLPFLWENPQTASLQDEHGYSLVHAAASYNRLDLLRALICEFDVDVNLKDEDDETALFVVETVEAAKLLVEDLGVDVSHRGSGGLTAVERLEAEGEFPAVVTYLKSLRDSVESSATAAIQDAMRDPSEGISVPMSMASLAGPEFHRRIQDFARRDDIDSAEGQADLRRMVEEALAAQDLE
ncbi:hypothetical protein CDD80_564 [Ophiocordyceps camponoti-rufipedis]|uniref:Uncharacterized protein n=1 Tax=Ophiocordyceps camponoti-rufipedis TaxID=2004952 RepID=A0A2C5YG82_9HYPO|nr:hypothetical protein CDD80_564 [Ophiocordyceps camponoti-rufipedis]